MPETEENGWEIGPTHLPAPAGASDVLADSIRKTPPPDVAAMKQLIPRSEAEWVTLVEERNELNRANVRVLADQFALTVEEERIGGVRTYRVSPPEIDRRHQDHLFVYVHGGAYVLNAGEAVGVQPAGSLRSLTIQFLTTAAGPVFLSTLITIHHQRSISATTRSQGTQIR